MTIEKSAKLLASRYILNAWPVAIQSTQLPVFCCLYSMSRPCNSILEVFLGVWFPLSQIHMQSMKGQKSISLLLQVLPYFQFYRGTQGKVAEFSASVSKIQRIRYTAVLLSCALCHCAVPRYHYVCRAEQRSQIPKGWATWLKHTKMLLSTALTYSHHAEIISVQPLRLERIQNFAFTSHWPLDASSPRIFILLHPVCASSHSPG